LTAAGRSTHAFDLVRELVTRDVKLRYRGTVLGIAWSQIGWLAQVAVLAFVFGRVVPLGVEDFPAFVLVGMLSWAWFSGGLSGATGSVVANGDLVRRPGFPAALLPVVSVAGELVQYVLAVPVVLLALVLYLDGVPSTAVALPVVMVVQALVMLGPAFGLAALHVRYRDTAHLVGVGLAVLFYASAIFFPRGAVPERYRDVLGLNPVARLVEAYRSLLMDGQWPAWRVLGLVAVAGAAATAAGYAFFRAKEPAFPDEL
jgi:lipopolysaccharide transport system permease protein